MCSLKEVILMSFLYVSLYKFAKKMNLLFTICPVPKLFLLFSSNSKIMLLHSAVCVFYLFLCCLNFDTDN